MSIYIYIYTYLYIYICITVFYEFRCESPGRRDVLLWPLFFFDELAWRVLLLEVSVHTNSKNSRFGPKAGPSWIQVGPWSQLGPTWSNLNPTWPSLGPRRIEFAVQVLQLRENGLHNSERGIFFGAWLIWKPLQDSNVELILIHFVSYLAGFFLWSNLVPTSRTRTHGPLPPLSTEFVEPTFCQFPSNALGAHDSFNLRFVKYFWRNTPFAQHTFCQILLNEHTIR